MDAFTILCSFCKQAFNREQGRFLFEGEVYICEKCIVTGVKKLGVDRVFADFFEETPDFRDATVRDAVRYLFGERQDDVDDVQIGEFLDRLKLKMLMLADVTVRRKRLEEEAARLDRELSELETKRQDLEAAQTERASALRDLRRRIENLQP